MLEVCEKQPRVKLSGWPEKFAPEFSKGVFAEFIFASRLYGHSHD